MKGGIKLKSIRVIIVDDDPLVLETLQYLLSQNEDIDVIGCFECAKDAIPFIIEGVPDVVLMDIQMPEMSGIEATRVIKNACPSIHVMMLTTFKDEQNIKHAILSGAEGYLIKSSEVSSMAIKIRALASGTVVLDQEALLELTRSKTHYFNELTPREHSILKLIAEGLSNKEISQHLFISEGTVRNNLTVILEKLNVRDRTQLAIMYLNMKKQ